MQTRAYRKRAFNGEIKSVTIFSNTKLREILEFSVYFPSTPSKLKVQVFVLLFLVTLFISPSILSLWELHALSLYKPLIQMAGPSYLLYCGYVTISSREFFIVSVISSQ